MLKEGMVKKGGRNEKPSSPRPKESPKGQYRKPRVIDTESKLDAEIKRLIKLHKESEEGSLKQIAIGGQISHLLTLRSAFQILFYNTLKGITMS